MPLENLVKPWSAEAFLAEIYGRRPIVLRHSGRTFANLMSLPLLARVLNFGNPRLHDVRLIADGEPFEPRSHSELIAGCREGATLIVNNIDLYDRDLAAYSAQLAYELGAPVKLNVYLSESGRQGSGTHFDSHDAFIHQIEGKKHWFIFDEPALFPIPGFSQPGDSSGSSAPILIETILEPGDVLYLPRGYRHHAIAVDGPSLHLVAGVYCPTGIDFLRWATEELKADVFFRQALPPGPLDSDAVFKKCLEWIDCLRNRIGAALSASEEMAARYRRHRLAAARPAIALRLPENIDRASIKIDSGDTIVRSLDQAAVIEKHDDTLTVAVRNKTITCAVSAEALLHFIFARHRFTVTEVEQRFKEYEKSEIVHLLGDLVYEGVLSVDDGSAASL